MTLDQAVKEVTDKNVVIATESLSIRNALKLYRVQQNLKALSLEEIEIQEVEVAALLAAP